VPSQEGAILRILYVGVSLLIKVAQPLDAAHAGDELNVRLEVAWIQAQHRLENPRRRIERTPENLLGVPLRRQVVYGAEMLGKGYRVQLTPMHVETAHAGSWDAAEPIADEARNETRWPGPGVCGIKGLSGILVQGESAFQDASSPRLRPVVPVGHAARRRIRIGLDSIGPGTST
jgi:hypothetical protein